MPSRCSLRVHFGNNFKSGVPEAQDMATIAVLYGSYRHDRQGIRAARFLMSKLQERGHEVTLLDAKEIDLPILDKMHKEFENAPDVMERVHDVLKKAEGFIFVTGEYNHSVQPGLKNLIDHFQKEYFFKPAGICAYSPGPFAGMRVAVHMRAILGELGMVSTSIIFGISSLHKALAEDGSILDEAYDRRADRFLDELEWYVDALKPARENGTPY